MLVSQMEFTDLEEKVSKLGRSVLNCFASDFGKAYVLAITRDGCPACEKQKPELSGLAETVLKKHRGKVIFIRLHVKQPSGDVTESLRAKDMFGHYFYPTNMIVIRTRDRGAVELYRNASPEMDELERNIESALETAIMMEKESN